MKYIGASSHRRYKVAWPIFCFLLCLTTSVRAQITVNVSDQYHVIDDYKLTVPGNALVPLALSIGDLRAGDVVSLTMKSSRDDTTFVVDLIPSVDYSGYVAARQKWFNNADRGRAFPASAPRRWDVKRSGPHLLVFAGEWVLGTAEVQLEANVQRRLSQQEQAAIKDWATTVANAVDSMFMVRPLRVEVVPCGYLNAISLDTGDIRLCTELLHRLGLSDGQFIGIFFHEFGHSLLRLWGMYGWDQEDIADDFAVYMLLQFDGGIGMAADFASYFQTYADPKEEALRVVTQGGRHSTGLQRYQNIQQRLRDPRRFMEEWNSQLYPRMRTEHLRRVVADPRPFGSQQLAAQVLSGRR
jgi:Putative metallopeptidase